MSRLRFLLVLGLLLPAGCPEKPATTKSVAGNEPSSSSVPRQVESEGKPGKAAPAVKQFILIYTGDTLSAVRPVRDDNDGGKVQQLGGICALAGYLLDYERSITALTRQRVEAAGGDATNLVVDTEKGLLGEHPFMLLDYGGWERATDKLGGPYVELQLRMYRDLHYSAVGVKAYEQLSGEQWQEYSRFATPDVLVRSAGAVRPGPQPGLQPVATVPLITREVHGERWGVVGVPLPPKDADPFKVWGTYVDEAAKQLQQGKCQHGILLLSGASKSLYAKLAKDTRFDVVIGVSPPALATAPGFGKINPDGPLMLPELPLGGQQFGACHLVYPMDGTAPAEYNFTLREVEDDLSSPYPYRKQAEAVAEAHWQAETYSK